MNTFAIKHPTFGYSTGGKFPTFRPAGKVWNSKSSFASHLSLVTKANERENEFPASLFKLYGDCYVVESVFDANCKTTPFKVWFAEYYKTADKFRKARAKAKAAMAIKAQVPMPAQNKVSSSASVSKQVGKSVPTNPSNMWTETEKSNVKNTLRMLEIYAPNVKVGEVLNNDTIGNYVVINIVGVSYALCKLK